MKSDTPAVNPSPAYPSSAARLQGLLDDLRLIHRAETCRIGGREVDVCSTCRPADGASAYRRPRNTPETDADVLWSATSGRELYPCPTLRLARRHARLGGVNGR